MTLRRIHIAEQHERPEEHLPVLAGQLHFALPVKIAIRSIDDMSDVGPVEAFAFGHKDFRGHQFFWRKNAGLDAVHHRRSRAFDP